MLVIPILVFFGALGGQIGVVSGQTAVEQSSKLQVEVPQFRTEVINYFGDKVSIWDQDQDGWEDFWCMLFRDIKHRNKTTDTDDDGVTDYDEMILHRDPMVPGPIPRKLTPEEQKAQDELNEKLRAENHARQVIQWKKDLDARAPFILTSETKKKHEEKQAEKRSKFLKETKERPFFVEWGHDRSQSLNQINTSNGNVSISPSGHNLRGAGVTVAIMEESVAPANHPDVGPITLKPTGVPFAYNNHTMSVAGVLASTGGMNAQGRGVAPDVDLWCYQINYGMSAQDRYIQLATGGSTISNHSYGPAYGWTGSYENHDNQGLYETYNGNIGVTVNEPSFAGQYREPVRAMDAVAHLYPSHLIVSLTGNARSQGPGLFPTPPEPEETTKKFYSRDNTGQWVLQTFAAGQALPKEAGGNDYGFDSLTSYGAAKNPIVVGGIYSTLTPWNFSGWGPTDDGRIKPDIVAQAAAVTAPYYQGNTPLYYPYYQGTSYAAPVVSGAAALITQAMAKPVTSDVLKAVMIHTATDVDLAGPDCRTGYGNLNIDGSVGLVKANNLLAVKPFIKHFVVQKGQVSRIKVKAEPSTSPFIKATLVWNDPEGFVIPGLDVTHDVLNKMLVNDLDLYVLKPGQVPNEIERPYVMNPGGPLFPALRGVNTLDNVEQVYINNAVGDGVYTIIVDGTKLTTDTQVVSLVFTGNTAGYEETKVIKITELIKVGENEYSLGWQSRAGESYTIQETVSLGVWDNVATGIQAIGDDSYYIVPSSSDKKFWRVIQE